jgi:hypothetical protein
VERNTTYKPYYIERKFRSIKRKIIWNFLQKKLDVILVSEFPKSGGSWYAKMLSEILDIPFPRNNSPLKFERSVLHGHVKYKDRYHKPIYVVRDGRDVVVSAYYHFLFENEYNIPEFVKNNRKKLNFKDYDDIEHNLPDFINYLYLDYGSKLGHTTWSRFVQDWADTDAFQVKYEDLLVKPVEIMVDSLKYLGKEADISVVEQVVENNKFNAQKKKTGSHQMSFVRKGISGDWKNYFNEKSKKVFKEFASKELIKLNYEKNDDW